jgi:hypothetical protein
VTGCELSLFAGGFLPGGSLYERLGRLGTLDQELKAAFGALPSRLNRFLAGTAAMVRSRFAGPVTYASGMWEPVDWTPFDIVAVDAYRDARNAATYESELRTYLGHGKPLVVTDYGCCGYAGAADRGGMGWAIIELDGDSPRLDGDYVRDEGEPGPAAARRPRHRVPGPGLGTQARVPGAGRPRLKPSDRVG